MADQTEDIQQDDPPTLTVDLDSADVASRQAADVIGEIGEAIQAATDAVTDAIEGTAQAAADLHQAVATELASERGQDDIGHMLADLPGMADGVLHVAAAEITLAADVHANPANLAADVIALANLADAALHAGPTTADFFAHLADLTSGVMTNFEALQESHHDGHGDHDTDSAVGPDMTVTYQDGEAHPVHFDALQATEDAHGIHLHATGDSSLGAGEQPYGDYGDAQWGGDADAGDWGGGDWGGGDL